MKYPIRLTKYKLLKEFRLRLYSIKIERLIKPPYPANATHVIYITNPNGVLSNFYWLLELNRNEFNKPPNIYDENLNPVTYTYVKETGGYTDKFNEWDSAFLLVRFPYAKPFPIVTYYWIIQEDISNAVSPYDIFDFYYEWSEPKKDYGVVRFSLIVKPKIEYPNVYVHVYKL